MFQNLVVPIDLSPESFNAIPVAARMVSAVAGRIDAVTVVDHLADVDEARAELKRGIDRFGPLAVEVRQIVHAGGSTADALARHLEHNPGSMILMSSHGSGRSAGIFGNTVDELLRTTFGPLIVLGPSAALDTGALDGTYVVPLDGSPLADSVLPIVSAWVAEFGGTPWVVEVVESTYPSDSDVIESSYVASRSARLARSTGHAVEFEVLHGRHAARPIVDFAHDRGASLIFMTTHGRTGFERLMSGSVTADVVRHAELPVVIFRPPNIAAPVNASSSGVAQLT